MFWWLVFWSFWRFWGVGGFSFLFGFWLFFLLFFGWLGMVFVVVIIEWLFASLGGLLWIFGGFLPFVFGVVVVVPVVWCFSHLIFSVLRLFCWCGLFGGLSSVGGCSFVVCLRQRFFAPPFACFGRH